MNLKEAFRYQNKLQRLMDEAQYILAKDRNVSKVENTALRHKVNPEAEDETTVEMPDTEYAEQITEVAVFLMFLLGEKELLSRAIRAAKRTTWGTICPVTRKPKNSRAYDRKKTQNWKKDISGSAYCA